MTGAWQDFALRHSGGRSLAILLGAAVVISLLLPFYNVVDYDVAFLTWTADRLLNGAVYGRDVLEISPPLSAFIYLPAVLMAPVVGFEGGVRVWMLVLTLLSLGSLWQCADKTLRLPVAAMLLVFVSLAFPNHFAQREQIALLLCTPYVAGRAPDRRWGIIVGLMAGIGFMLKPFFLIPLAAVFALRRRIGTEEAVIVTAGAAYAISLLLFFQPYLREMVPAAIATYWAVYSPWTILAKQAVFILGSTVPMALAGAPLAVAAPYAAATIGFVGAAVLQQKGFVYHFIPAYGFLALFMMVKTFDRRPVIALVAVAFLIVEAAMIAQAAMHWRAVDFSTERLQVTSALNAEIDRSTSYLSLAPAPYVAFPAAIHTSSRYVGIGSHPASIPAVARFATGLAQGDPSKANALAMSQVLRELADRPELVITLDVPYVVDDKTFDILAWFNQDPRFREAWKDYAPDKTIGPFLLYRRR